MKRLLVVLALVLATAAPAATPLRVHKPFAVAADRNGTLLVPDGQLRRVLRVNPKTKAVTYFAPRVPDILAVTVARGRVYLAQHATDVVLRVDGASATPVTPKLGGPVALAAAPDGSVVVAEIRGRVQRISAGGEVTLVAGRGEDASDGDGGDPALAGLNHPQGVAVGPDGTVYIADTDGGSVRRVANGEISTLAAGLDDPLGLAVDRDGSVLVAEAGRSRVVRVARDGRTSTVTTRVRYPNGIAIAPNGALYVASQTMGAVYRVARTTGIATRVSR